ncbi:MFS transporter [Crenobacter sp. SG2305]|uniref:MFS transporter n=1 Tax=Crenobacter oryzisoli TaxID=3056844 RepID=UPI0025AB0316|nr:MFS transporter [Crenobacter sp. SG2305]MDN0082008.1 MFS transporter [Crenobacter sp. SG2305]
MDTDRYGPGKVLGVGALLYAAGLTLMTVSATPELFALFTGVLIGLALSATTHSVIFGVICLVAPPSCRSRAMGLTVAAGSFGQFAMVPIERGRMDGLGWLSSLLVLTLCTLLIVPAARPLATLDKVRPSTPHGEWLGEMRRAFCDAWRLRDFRLLMASYFICGFQMVFIGMHLPAYLRDHGLAGGAASLVLTLIGLFNIFGAYTAGELGTRVAKPRLLTGIYAGRAAW